MFSSALLLFGGRVLSADAVKLSPELERYVRVQTPTVILTHVRVIDGTGKPAVDDRNLIIEHGKISQIEAGRDVLAMTGATVLDLRGYSVMPGIVGMHNHLYYIARPNFEPGQVPAWEAPLRRNNSSITGLRLAPRRSRRTCISRVPS